MRILVIGSGGREHALLNAMQGHDLTVAPGNAGMSRLATVRAVDVTSPQAIVDLAREINAELVVIGPEVPLVAGAADALIEAGVPVFGPTEAAAITSLAKALDPSSCAAGVPTASATRVEKLEEVEAALDEYGPRYVVKDDGLAGGKGVVVTPDRAAARAHVDAVLAAGNPVLLESFLDGPEVSLFCLVDGETVVPLLPAQDHKRAYDNDEGPNTGGMGAYTPLPWLPEDGVQRIVDEVCIPVAKEMARRGTPYSGLLYAGLAWGEEGPAVVEFNCRFGDPETQAVLSLLKSPLAEALHATATGTLSELPPLEWEDGFAVIIVMAAEGYPASPRKGDAISGAALDDPQRVLHAGTVHTDGAYRTAGGRVLSVLGKGATLADARADAYATVDGIEFAGGFVRRDIGKRAEDGEISL